MGPVRTGVSAVRWGSALEPLDWLGGDGDLQQSALDGAVEEDVTTSWPEADFADERAFLYQYVSGPAEEALA